MNYCGRTESGSTGGDCRRRRLGIRKNVADVDVPLKFFEEGVASGGWERIAGGVVDEEAKAPVDGLRRGVRERMDERDGEEGVVELVDHLLDLFAGPGLRLVHANVQAGHAVQVPIASLDRRTY